MSTQLDSTTSITSLSDGLSALAGGLPVLVETDGAGSCLLFAASLAHGEAIGWMVRHTSGFLLAATTADRLDALDIPPMVNRHEPAGGGFAVSVDAKSGITTGISGRDRATTLRALATSEPDPGALTRPGHIVPVCTEPDGVLARAAAFEAAVDLVRLSGLVPVAAMGTLLGENGEVLDSTETACFAAEHGLACVSVPDVVAHRLHTEPVVARRRSADATRTEPTADAGSLPSPVCT